MADVAYIQMPWWQLPLLMLLPLAFISILILWLRRIVHKQAVPEEERDWSVPPLAEGGDGSLVHRWDVRCKIATLLVYSFIIASLQHPGPACAAVCISLVVSIIAKIPLRRVLFRLLALAGFLGMFLVVMPFTVATHDGDMIVVFGGMEQLGLNLRGLILAATIIAKAVAIALLMEPLVSTAPLPVTLHGLTRLGAPEMVSQMVLLSHRYVHVFRHEARRMAAGMQVRGFSLKTDLETMRAIANFLGMLFVRSFERTERVFDAMQARGYNGRFHEPDELHINVADVCGGIIILSVGVALLFFDRVGLQV
ncbi:MAG: cobalt ECF transporter T component CbiQ [Thermodesulfobacteriota bacterium]|nr:cobalt ECF transporter T component CbiQ [Thermodesulfobacteriota bacterium]